MSTIEEPIATAAAALRSTSDSFIKANTAQQAIQGAPTVPPPVDFADPKNAVQAARAVLDEEPEQKQPEQKHIDAVVNTAQGLATGAAAANNSVSTVPVAFPPLILQASGPNVLPAQSRAHIATGMFWLAGASAVGTVVTELVSGAGNASADRAALFLAVLAMISTVTAYLTTMGFGAFRLTAGTQTGQQDGAGKPTP